LSSHAKFFPAGTVHLAVVDPGVGTGRRLLAVHSEEQIYVAPDNGLLDFCIERGVSLAVEITNRNLWRQPASMTFHGRDILAPVAAHLSLGMSLKEAGEPIEMARRLPKPICSVSAEEIVGQVVYVDRFGNLITNVSAGMLREFNSSGNFAIYLGKHHVGTLQSTYGVVDSGCAVAVVGGFDLLEIGVNGGSARRHFNVGVGAMVIVRKNDEATNR
jgi:hypothetical protein